MGPKMDPFSGPCFMLVFWLGGGFKTSKKKQFSDFPKNGGPHFELIFPKNLKNAVLSGITPRSGASYLRDLS